MNKTRKQSFYKGLYPPEIDVESSGVWVQRELFLPVIKNGASQISIHGSVDKAALRKKNKKPIHISVSDGEQVVRRKIIIFDGEFRLNLRISCSQRIWKISCSHDFIPSKIGRGNDHRTLSWRVFDISMGGESLINCRRKNICLNIIKEYSETDINVVGFFSKTVGLAEGARAMEQACLKSELKARCIDVDNHTIHYRDDLKMDSKIGFDIYHVNFDSINAAVEKVKNYQRKTNRYSIGYWAWEQSRLPSVALSGFDYLDEVWVPSQFVLDSVSRSSPVPVVRIQHAISPPLHFRKKRADFGIPDDKIAVLTLFDFDSGCYRKNPEAAIKAFKIAERDSDHGFLIIKVKKADHYKSNFSELMEIVGDNKNVLIINEELSRSDIWDLMNSCDVLMSLHRAEGFGLCMAEMMALGKVVIGTGWSGNLDFMNHENSCLVDYDLKPLEKSNAFGNFIPNELWAEANPVHAAEYLEKIYRDKDYLNNIGCRAKSYMDTNFSLTVMGNKIKERLNVISMWYS